MLGLIAHTAHVAFFYAEDPLGLHRQTPRYNQRYLINNNNNNIQQ